MKRFGLWVEDVPTNATGPAVPGTGDDDTTQITVSAVNIDDIIRAIKRKLYANDGVDLAVEKGIFPKEFVKKLDWKNKKVTVNL